MTAIIYETMLTVSEDDILNKGTTHLLYAEETVVDELIRMAARSMVVGRDYWTSLRIVTVCTDSKMGLLHLTYQAKVTQLTPGEQHELPQESNYNRSILHHINSLIGDPTSVSQ